LRYSIQVWHI